MKSPLERIALGTAQLSSAYGIANRRGAGDRASANAILRAAVDGGLRWIDTAPDYGEAETWIGEFLAGATAGDETRVCTKLAALPEDAPPGSLAECVAQRIAASCSRLRRSTLDCVLLHGPDDLRRHGAPLVAALDRARRDGRVDRIGVSVYDTEDAELALSHAALSAIQYPFSLLDRRFERSGIASRLRRAGFLIFARSPLLQGLLALDPDTLPDRVRTAGPWLATLRRILTTHDLEPVATALAFASQRSGADHVVLGVDGPRQLLAAASSVAAPLPGGFLAAVDRELGEAPITVIDPRRWEPAAA